MRHLFTTSNLAIYTDGPISSPLLFLWSELKELEEQLQKKPKNPQLEGKCYFQ